MSGFNQFTALTVERNWDLLSTTIDRVGENERRQMASQPFNQTRGYLSSYLPSLTILIQKLC